MSLLNYTNVIPSGLDATYASPNALIDALNALNPGIINQIAYFVSRISLAANVRGCVSIKWNCPAQGTTICGRTNLRQLSGELNQLDNKGKVMMLVAINYYKQTMNNNMQGIRCNCNFVFGNTPLFNAYWT